MNELLKNYFRMQIKSLTGFNFQDFIKELFLLKYGAAGFVVLRKQKDKGCDGIVVSERRVIACYGPEHPGARKFYEKVENDFKSYQNHWEAQYPNWMFITNHDTGPDLIAFIHKLKPHSPLLGLSNIISIIEDFDSCDRRQLGHYLRIPDEFLSQDYISEILDDLLKDSVANDNSVKYTKPAYVPDKIELNYDAEEIDAATTMFENASTHFIRIKDIIQGYRDRQITIIKNKVMDDYINQRGTFKERFSQQTLIYLEKYSGDDNYRTFIQAILLYHFEQCLIGKKTEAEK